MNDNSIPILDILQKVKPQKKKHTQSPAPPVSPLPETNKPAVVPSSQSVLPPAPGVDIGTPFTDALKTGNASPQPAPLTTGDIDDLFNSDID